MSQLLKNHIEQIVPISQADFEYVLSHFEVKNLKKHQFLIQEGQMVTDDFFVVSGLLKAYFENQEGKMHILQFAMSDWWITDYQAHFSQSPATLNIDCLENTQVLALSFDNREKICREIHAMEHFFRKKSNAGYVALQKRILSLLNYNAQERFELLMQQYPVLLQKVPKSLIASFLGVSRETLSRFVKK